MANTLRAEIGRKKLLGELKHAKLKVGYTLAIGFFLILFLFKSPTYIHIQFLVLLCVCIAVYLEISKRLLAKFELKFTDEFANSFLAPLAGECSLIYLPISQLDEECLARSELLSKDIDHLFSFGTISSKEGDFSLNSIQIYENYHKTSSKKGFRLKNLLNFSQNKEQKSKNELFFGMIFYKNFNLVSKTRFFILPSGKTPDADATKIDLNDMNLGGEFSEIYTVFSNDKEFASRFMNANLAKFMISLCQKYAVPPILSFVYGRLYIMIDSGENGFKPALSLPLNRQTEISNLDKDIQFLLELINNLKLDPLIWHELTIQPPLCDVLNLKTSNTNIWSGVI